MEAKCLTPRYLNSRSFNASVSPLKIVHLPSAETTEERPTFVKMHHKQCNDVHTSKILPGDIPFERLLC